MSLDLFWFWGFLLHVQLFQHHLVKRLPFTIVLPLFLCQKTVGYIYVDLFLSSLVYSIDLFIFFFFQQYHTVLITVTL